MLILQVLALKLSTGASLLLLTITQHKRSSYEVSIQLAVAVVVIQDPWRSGATIVLINTTIPFPAQCTS